MLVGHDQRQRRADGRLRDVRYLDDSIAAVDLVHHDETTPGPMKADSRRSRLADATNVGLFVGLFCQPTSGSGRFIAVDSPTTKSAGSPATTGLSCKPRYAGGGTRTPDTRIMIPLL